MIDSRELRFAAIKAIAALPEAAQLRAEFSRQAVITDSAITIGDLEAQNVGKPEFEADKEKSCWNIPATYSGTTQCIVTKERATELLADVATIRAFMSALRP